MGRVAEAICWLFKKLVVKEMQVEEQKTSTVYQGFLFNAWVILILLSPFTMIAFFFCLASWLDGYSPAIWPSILLFLAYALPMWYADGHTPLAFKIFKSLKHIKL